MSVQIVWIPYDYDGNIIHIGTGYSKEECLRLIGHDVPEGNGVYEYIVEDNKMTRYASGSDYLAIKKTLDRIFS